MDPALLSVIVTHQFLICGIIAASIASYILLKVPRSWASITFVVFAINVSLWEFVVFLHRTAPTLEITMAYFTFVKITFPLLIPLYLLTILNIWREERQNLLFLIPGFVYIWLQFQVEFQFIQTEFGWTYIASGTIPQYLIGVILFGYTLFTAFKLYFLIQQAPSPTVKRKFTILFWSFLLFQAIGVTVSNAVLAFSPHTPPIGGFSYLLTFGFIAYAMLIKEDPLIQTPIKNAFLENYTSFLQAYYATLPGNGLGQKSFQFRNMLRESGIDTYVSFSEGTIHLMGDEYPPSHIEGMIQTTIDYLAEKTVDATISHHLRQTLDAIYPILNDDFIALIKNNEEYLKKSDIVYRLAGGRFLTHLDKDTSLDKVDDGETCIRLYKRLLLPVVDRILQPTTASEFHQIQSKSPLTAAVEIDVSGDLSFHRVRQELQTYPTNKQVTSMVDEFTPLVCWVYQHLKSEETLDRLRYVLTLNEDRAIELGVTSRLLLCLNRNLPASLRQRLYVPKGYTGSQLDVFSRPLDITHAELVGRNLLLEVNPREYYETYVTNYVLEALANTERCLLFTPKGSSIYTNIVNQSLITRVNVFCLSPTVSRVTAYPNETMIPLYDITQILDTVNKNLTHVRRSRILFDNISELIFSQGFEKAYRFLRHATELTTSNQATALFLYNVQAHDNTVKSAIEGIFNIILTIEKNRISRVK